MAENKKHSEGKAIRIAAAIISAAAVLAWALIPTYQAYQDGGSQAWRAPVYIYVKWNASGMDEPAEGLYLFPDSYKEINQLWDEKMAEQYGMNSHEISEIYRYRQLIESAERANDEETRNFYEDKAKEIYDRLDDRLRKKL